MISGSAAFEQIIDALQPKLSAQGFTLRVAREHAQTFGSRYMTFSDGTRFIRLVWDGREEWFVLEGDDAPHDRPSSGAPVWVDLTLQRFNAGEADARWVAEVVSTASALCSFSGGKDLRPSRPTIAAADKGSRTTYGDTFTHRSKPFVE